jgi:hypothetical protein
MDNDTEGGRLALDCRPQGERAVPLEVTTRAGSGQPFLATKKAQGFLATEVEQPTGADTNHIGVPKVNVIAQPRTRQDAGGRGHILGKGSI